MGKNFVEYSAELSGCEFIFGAKKSKLDGYDLFIFDKTNKRETKVCLNEKQAASLKDSLNRFLNISIKIREMED